MSAPDQIKQLVAQFHHNIHDYTSAAYKEAELRSEFIDPFFEALDWDVHNKKNVPPSLKDVIVEKSINVPTEHSDSEKNVFGEIIPINTNTTSADYCFRINKRIQFFVEAKKPSIHLTKNKEAAIQLRRYGWSAKVPFSILTNFEEFAIYRCQLQPTPNDNAAKECLKRYHYTDYENCWHEIYDLFSYSAVKNGSINAYLEANKLTRGYVEVDSAFLAQMNEWRELLAKSIIDLNRQIDISETDLNYAVQMTLDRILFLRICEERDIEPYEQILHTFYAPHIYPRLKELFKTSDRKYNSGLFHFAKEKGREEPDTFTLNLNISDTALRTIITNLYPPESNYQFRYIPIEIIGHVYEQFLGKVITIKGNGVGKKVEVEDKLEVRKAGGVYYTPTYIVDYIVEQTAGELLKACDVNQTQHGLQLNRTVTILDPACGSGSFLIGAYTYLLNWYSEKLGRDLTIDEKKQVLLNHIYGVDVDPQAVEVTKLSLLLKVLEGETFSSIQHQEKFQRRALPDLHKNIKCGNSLIDTDFITESNAETLKIRPFHWEKEFESVIKTGGFDVVIGNPPYVFGRDWKNLHISDDVKVYLGSKYKSSPYQLDMFSVFMEKASLLCKLHGIIGQIVPNVWLTNTYSDKTRRLILNHSYNLVLLNPPKNVFKGLTVDTIIYTYKKEKESDVMFAIKSMKDDYKIVDIAMYKVTDFINGKNPISLSLDYTSANLVNDIKSKNHQLSDFADITRGVHPYRSDGYGKSAFQEGFQTKQDVLERPYHSKVQKKGHRPFIYGRDLKRFTSPKEKEYIKYGSWLAEPRDAKFFEGTRVYSRKILSDRLLVTVETKNSVADQQVYITLPKQKRPSAFYLAGIMGSKLISFFIKSYYDEINDDFPQIKVKQLRELPIPHLNENDSRHDQIEKLVLKMLSLNEEFVQTKSPSVKKALEIQIEQTDQQIDQLVYALYELNDAEIKIIEES